MKNKDFTIEYIFNLVNRNEEKRFTVVLDKNTLISQSPYYAKEEMWTLLDYHKCKICTLNSNDHKNCPIAFNISGLANEFADFLSIEEVEITVNVEERRYFKKDSVQQGLRSILGIYLATSGCPHMNILKPMARFHLPFASMEETIYRHIGNYLLYQYFEYHEGKKFDSDLKDFVDVAKNIDIVNQGICTRIESISDKDANKNALIILNTIGVMLDLELQMKFDSIKYLFNK